MMEEECEQEIVVIQSMYNEEEVWFRKDRAGIMRGRFWASQKLPPDFHISVQYADKENTEGHQERLFPVAFLPPIELDTIFPSCYPSKKPPFYMITCSWLTGQQLSKLCHRLDEIWMENRGSVILHHWFSFLENEALEYLEVKSPVKLSDEEPPPTTSGTPSEKKDIEVAQNTGDPQNTKHDLDSSTAHQGEQKDTVSCDSQDSPEFYICYCADPGKTCPMSHDGLDCRAVQRRQWSVTKLLYSLLDFNKRKKQQVFNETIVECNVCFAEKRGHMCMRFEPCCHAFCKECVGSYFTQQIKDGKVNYLNCLESKCNTEAHPHQVKAVVSKDLFDCYEKFLLKNCLEGMADIMYCPRRTCQYPTTIDDDFGHCPRCYYAFCVHCTQEYHGKTPCPITADKIRTIGKEYRRGNRETKQALEKRYGKRIVKHAAEESDSLAWVHSNTKPCPKCLRLVQKEEGCNKVTCVCGANFCYLCGHQLLTEEPYWHFLTRLGQCYGRLFDGYDPDGDEYFDYEEEEGDWFEEEEEGDWYEEEEEGDWYEEEEEGDLLW